MSVSEARNIVHLLPREDQRRSVLIVEDNRIERLFMAQLVQEAGYDVVEAENGQQAIDILTAQKRKIDIILLDRLMPVLDGLSVVFRLKNEPELKRIPVIMITGSADSRNIEEGIDAGVFYYLVKPVDTGVLKSVLSSAEREVRKAAAVARELRRYAAGFSLMQTSQFALRSVDEAEALAAFLAHCFPEPERVIRGLAELMINAVEHGLYGIGFDHKGELIRSGRWRQEVDRLAESHKQGPGQVEVTMKRQDKGIYVVITDPGEGFAWRDYLTIDPARATSPHGRGIARAAAESFDKIAYNEKGNQVVAYVSAIPVIQW